MKFVHIADMHFDTPFTLLSDRANLGEIRRLDQRKAFKKMADEGTVTTTVTGTLTPPPPSPPITPYGGSATGSISCDSTAMVQALKILFSNMYTHAGEDDYNGNLEFAKELATQLNSFWTSGRISTSGEGNIEGSSGSGSIS